MQPSHWLVGVNKDTAKMNPYLVYLCNWKTIQLWNCLNYLKLQETLCSAASLVRYPIQKQSITHWNAFDQLVRFSICLMWRVFLGSFNHFLIGLEKQMKKVFLKQQSQGRSWYVWKEQQGGKQGLSFSSRLLKRTWSQQLSEVFQKMSQAWMYKILKFFPYIALFLHSWLSSQHFSSLSPVFNVWSARCTASGKMYPSSHTWGPMYNTS